MADCVASTTSKKCDQCVTTANELLDVQVLLGRMEDKITNIPSYIEQIVTQLRHLNQEWLDINANLAKLVETDDHHSKIEKEMQALWDKIRLVPSYMDELKDIHGTLHKEWLDAKSKVVLTVLEKQIKENKI